jgi:TolB-like protein/Tfp pilus assembly protein PilF
MESGMTNENRPGQQSVSLFTELKRRNVFKVGFAYAVTAWLMLQVAQLGTESFEAPAWVMKLLIMLLLAGFPLALILGWLFDLTPEGLRKERDVDRSQPAYQALGRKLNMTIISVLVLALAWFAWDKFHSNDARPSYPIEAAVEPARAVDPVVRNTVPLPTIAKSIAVLPFATRSDQQADAWFSQGIHDDLLTQLAKIGEIKVTSRTSVMRFADSNKPIPEIAAELGVATVLEGAIQRSGDRVRINAQLIDAGTDTHLWAETWDKELTASNIFEIQSELATLIATALRAELAPDLRARIDDKPTESLAAYDLALRGRYLMDKEMSEENLERAAALFRQAIEADPEYAAAWSGLSQALLEMVGWFYKNENEVLPEAWLAAERAVTLDPEFTDAWLALGDLQRMTRQFEAGEQSFQKALALSPNNADAHGRYSDLLRDARRFDESVREIRRAVELDPYLLRIRESLLQNVYFARDFAIVEAEAKKLLELEPNAANTWYWLSLAQTMQGRHDEAEQSMLKAIEFDPGNPYYDVGLAFAYALAGRDKEALQILEQAEDKRFSLVEIALVYGVLGDMDRAFAYLDRAFAESPASLYYIAADPGADAMREDPRWQELLQRLNAE